MDFLKKNSKVWLGTLVVRGLNFGGNLLILSVTANALSPSEFGYWIIFTGLLVFIASIDLGLGNSLQTALSFRAAKQGEAEFHSLYLAGMKLLGLFSVALALVSVICLEVFRRWDKNHLLAHPVPTALVLMLSVILVILAGTSQKALLAKLQFGLFNLTSSASVVAQLAWSAAAWGCKLGLLAFCMAPIAGYVVVLLIAHRALGRSTTVPAKPLTMGETYVLLRKSARGFAVPQIVAQAFQFLPAVIIGATGGPAMAGLIGSLVRVAGYLLQIASIITMPLRPIFSHSYVTGDVPHCRTVLRQSMMLIGGIYLVLGVVLTCFGHSYLPLLVGDVAKGIATPTLLGLSLFIFAHAFAQPIAAFLNGIDCLTGQAIYGSATAVVALVAISPLAKLYGEAGVMAAMALPFLLINLPFALYESEKKLRSHQV